MRGRKPKPFQFRVIDGNAGRRPLDEERIPKPTGDLTDPPQSLNERQAEIWRTAIANAPAGLLKRLDFSIFKIWVVACDYHDEAMKMVNKYGTVIKAPHSELPIQSPYMAIINKQSQIMMKAAAELGFSPTSRSRVRLEGSAPSSNRFTELKELGPE